MHRLKWLAGFVVVASMSLVSTTRAQTRPYIGYVYPAGGQQSTTFQIRLGGQTIDDTTGVLVTGAGVTAKVVECLRRLNNQEVQLLNEQVRALRRATSAVASASMQMMSENAMMMMSSAAGGDKAPARGGKDPATLQLISRIEKRTREFVQTPACAAIASLVLVEVTIAPDASPGERQIRLVTARGVSNPLPFHVGQVPEYTRKPMLTARIQTLGKEAAALRNRPPEEAEVSVTLPCTVNGQIASGEVNRYRFEAKKGQRLVCTTLGRQLIPFIADAVPGWFQPVIALYDERDKEVAYEDDFRFKPDPTLFYEVPKDGEYVLAIHDSIYRGREDFVYRITLGELPFITSVFPLGARVGEVKPPKISGWNVDSAPVTPVPKDAPEGTQWLAAKRKEQVSNRVPFEVGTLPELLEQEPNNEPEHPQEVTLPVMINGRINQADDWDVFAFEAKANETVVVEVRARRLDSPLDSIIKLTNAKGKVLSFNDDSEDLGAGANTHHADSYLLAKIPAGGRCYVYIGDTTRSGGEAYAYRLRISAPQPDFDLRVVPSNISLRTKSSANLTVYALRQDGFTGPIKLSLKNPPPGLSAAPVTLAGTQAAARLTIKSDARLTKEPVTLTVMGTAQIGGKEVARAAVPAEDRMQAFLWRHLVPAEELKVLVMNPANQPVPKRKVPVRYASIFGTNSVAMTNAGTGTALKTGVTNAAAAKPKFTKQQIAGRLRQLKFLYEEGYLIDEFYLDKVDECQAGQ